MDIEIIPPGQIWRILFTRSITSAAFSPDEGTSVGWGWLVGPEVTGGVGELLEAGGAIVGEGCAVIVGVRVGGGVKF